MKAKGIRKRSKPKVFEIDFSGIQSGLPEPFQLVQSKRYEHLENIEKIMKEREEKMQTALNDHHVDK